MSYFERTVALRYLRSRRKEGFISVIAWFSLLGIALGVATLIVVMAVMNGFRTELIDKILGVNGHITVYGGAGDGISDYQKLSDKFSELGGVISVTPLVEGQVMAGYKSQTSGAQVKGLRYEDLKSKRIVSENLNGNIEDFHGSDAIMIGVRLASKLGVNVGDDLTLISPSGHQTVMGMVPRVKAYKVVGIFEVGMFEYDSITILMPLEAAQILFKYPDRVSAIEMRISDPNSARKTVRELVSMLPNTYMIYDWQRANADFVNALKVERNVMFFILTLIIIVAAFNIISSMIMLVRDKNRDIAVLRTIGASKASIMKVFLITGSMIGVTGTIAGFLLGVSFALNIENIRQFLQSIIGAELFSAEIYYLTKLPAEVRAEDVLLVVLMSLGLTFLATIYPAWKASKTDPAEVLRYG